MKKKKRKETRSSSANWRRKPKSVFLSGILIKEGAASSGACTRGEAEGSLEGKNVG